MRKVFTHGPVEAVDAVAPPGYRRRWEAHHPSAGEDRTLRAMREWLRLDAEALRGLVAPTSFSRRTSTRLDALPEHADLRRSSDVATWDTLTALLLDRLAGEGLEVLVLDASPAVDGLHAVKVVVPGLEVETLSYGRIGERNAARLLGRVHRGRRAGGGPGGSLGAGGRPGRRRGRAADPRRHGAPRWTGLVLAGQGGGGRRSAVRAVPGAGTAPRGPLSRS